MCQYSSYLKEKVNLFNLKRKIRSAKIVFVPSHGHKDMISCETINQEGAKCKYIFECIEL